MHRSSRRLVVPLVAMTIAVTACSDDTSTFPGGTSPESPGIAALVQDANHAVNGLLGTAGFYLLPPVANTLSAPTGTFNPDLMPLVVACEFTDPATPLETADQLPEGDDYSSCLTLAAEPSADDEYYQANWDTNKDDAGVFRVFVTFGNPLAEVYVLGFVDISLISGGGAKRTRDGADVDAEVQNAGRTIPVKFRIETEGLAEEIAGNLQTVLIPGPSDDQICDPVNQASNECIIATVPPTGGEFVVPGASPFGGAIAGISLPDGWSSEPRNLLITCNNGTFSTGANPTSDFGQLQFAAGEGPLGSAADPNVIAEWPLFCEFVFDPAFGPNESLPNGLTATIGLCDVDPDSDAAQGPLHHTDLDLGSPLIQVGRNTGGLDGLGNIPSGSNPPIFDHTGTDANDDFTKAAAPSFLDCTGAAVPIASAIGSGLVLPDAFGHLASVIGDFVTPDALYASGTMVRDGGIGATIGSVRTIYGLVELDPGPISDYSDPVGFLNTGATIPSNWASSSYDPTGGDASLMKPGIFVTSSSVETCSIYNPPSGATVTPLPIGVEGASEGFGLNEAIILQKRFDLSAAATGLRLHIAIDNDFRFAVNGTEYTVDRTNAPFLTQVDGDPAVGLHSTSNSAPGFPSGYGRSGTHGLSAVADPASAAFPVTPGETWLRHENCAVADDVVIDLSGVMIPGQENVITVLARDRGTVGVVGMKIEAEYGGHSN